MSKIKFSQKLGYRMAVDFTCENCGKSEEEVGTLEVHRINRGYLGGKYYPVNVKIICNKCHRLIHGKEFK